MLLKGAYYVGNIYTSYFIHLYEGVDQFYYFSRCNAGILE